LRVGTPATPAHFARLRSGRADPAETSALHLDALRDLKRVSTELVAAAAYPVYDRPITGRSVLDIGCWDGAYSIEAVRRGASRVLATDHFVWHEGWGDRRCFELARAHLAPSIEVMD
jgi:predicted nicotinamide N-methyase